MNALAIGDASTSVTAGFVAPLSRDMEYSQVLCVENENYLLSGINP